MWEPREGKGKGPLQILFDVTNRTSFLNVVKWKRDLDAKCLSPDARPIPCILIANKVPSPFLILCLPVSTGSALLHDDWGRDADFQCDVEGERAVTAAEVESLCTEGGFSSWAEVSVK